MGGGAWPVYGWQMILRLASIIGVLVLAGLSLMPGPVRADVMLMGDVTVCPARTVSSVLPDFEAPGCRRMNAYGIDPQDRLIWVRGTVSLDRTTGGAGEPLSLAILGKMSSTVYVNGVLVGRNGRPGLGAASEVPGRMDAILYPAPGVLKVGENEVVFLASSHHGFLHLGAPFHGVRISASSQGTDLILRYFWPSLLTLGIFLSGFLYFGAMAVVPGRRRQAANLSLISLLAAAQLVAEVMRGLIGYDYPVHDVRLVLITLFSAGFGLTVSLHVMQTFRIRQIGLILLGLCVLCAAVIAVAPGFDTKAEYAMMAPLVVTLLATGLWTFKRQPKAFAYFLVLAGFIGSLRVFPYVFLDVVFFYLVAALLLFLFVQQAIIAAGDARRRREQELRASRLELALEQARERQDSSYVQVSRAGHMERLSADQIAYCRGLDGYSEIVLEGGREILHGASLGALENSLPSTFLRVHRSYLVNTARVQSLSRDASGTGELTLSTGHIVPVSRRTMPQVRRALA